MWEGVGDRTELHHIDPYSIGHNRVSFPFSWAAQPGAWGPSLSGTCSSIQHLLSTCNCSVGGLRAHSAGCWLSLPHLVSNSSDLQLFWSPTDWISCALSYIIVYVHLPLVGVTNRTHSTRPRSRLYSDIPRPDAPVIYTGVFPILTAWVSRRSICNITTQKKNRFKYTMNTIP